MTWVLIIVLGLRGGVTTSDFSSKESCMAAAKTIADAESAWGAESVKNGYTGGNVVVVCAAK